MLLKAPVVTKGERGVTVCYTINNIWIEDGKLKWGEFNFYTPLGDMADAQGDKYFIVPASEFEIPARDLELDIEIKIKITKEGGVEPLATYVGNEGGSIQLELEGDIVVYGIVPCNPSQEIEIAPRKVEHIVEIEEGVEEE